MVAAAALSNSKPDMAQILNKLDQEGEAYMEQAEKKNVVGSSPAGFPSLLRPCYGFVSARCTILFCGVYAAQQGDVKSKLHLNSRSKTSNFACRSVRKSVITFESTGNGTGGNT
jgi:hypothetical protein